MYLRTRQGFLAHYGVMAKPKMFCVNMTVWFAGHPHRFDEFSHSHDWLGLAIKLCEYSK